MDFSLLLTSIAIGLAVTAPLGPVNILVIRNAIRRGFAAGVLLGVAGVGLARKRIELATLEGDEAQTAKLAGKMLAAFGLTITNPGEFFGFIAIFGTMN